MKGFTDEAVQNEIIKLTDVLTVSLPVLEEYSQSNLDALTISGELSQVIADWNLPTQMETLNTGFAEALTAQDALSQELMEGLNTTLFESFAAQDALSQELTDGMNTSLFELFAAQDALSLASMNSSKNIFSLVFLNNGIRFRLRCRIIWIACT